MTLSSDMDRFMDKVSIEPTCGCWLWTGICQSRGYGSIFMDGRMQLAHRVSWSMFKGQIPDGMVVCHAHDDKWCVNPDHLFLGTHADNSRDMVKKGRQWLQKRTHCPRGHALVAGNLVEGRLKQGHRICLACCKARPANRARDERRAQKKASK